MKKRYPYVSPGAALTAAFLVSSAYAAPTVDYTDLWYNPSETGWGVNLIQQDDTIFATLFVYGTNGAPTWFVASGATLSGNGAFQGTLYRTSGPYFGGAFNPSAVGVTQVGTFNFFPSSDNSATLSYSVDGTQVTKSVSRQTWDLENVAGNYLGAAAGTWSGCGAGRDGYQENSATYIISQDGIAVQMREQGSGYTCSYAGTYSQSGRMGAIAGGGSCTDGIQQTFSAQRVQATPQGISMAVTFGQGSCRFTGRLAAVRRTP